MAVQVGVETRDEVDKRLALPRALPLDLKTQACMIEGLFDALGDRLIDRLEAAGMLFERNA